MEVLNKVAIFFIGISQVVFASKINPQAVKVEKGSIQLKNTLAQELKDKKLINSENSTESSNCIGKLTD